jgi:hypothetical protein
VKKRDLFCAFSGPNGEPGRLGMTALGLSLRRPREPDLRRTECYEEWPVPYIYSLVVTWEDGLLTPNRQLDLRLLQAYTFGMEPFHFEYEQPWTLLEPSEHVPEHMHNQRAI